MLRRRSCCSELREGAGVVVPSAELNAVKQRFLISSTARRSDGVHVRLLGDAARRGAGGGSEPGGCVSVFAGDYRDGKDEWGGSMKSARDSLRDGAGGFLERVRRTAFC